MALNDAATLIIDAGNYFTAPVGTPLPIDLLTVSEADWENIGHTSIDEILSASSEGGEKTILATLQAKSLRTRTAPRTESFAVTLQQWDTASLKLYHGSNAVENADGTLGVPDTPTPTLCAFLAVFLDGDKVFAIYAPKAEIIRGEDISLSDTENLAGLPLQVTPLSHNGAKWPYAITPIGDVATP